MNFGKTLFNTQQNLTQFLSESQKDFFVGADKIILKCIWKGKATKIIKINFTKNNKVREIILPDFNTYCTVIVINTVLYWWRDRHMDQWDIIKNPEIYAQVILDKGVKATLWRHDSLSIVLEQVPIHPKEKKMNLIKSHLISKLTQNEYRLIYKMSSYQPFRKKTQEKIFRR